ncbi:MAG: 6,7-dimethyl-8-ribityllumazine synthase [Bacteroidia bacterium]
MATALHNLSDYDASTVPSGADKRIAIVVAEWNAEITHALAAGAINTLLKHEVAEDHIELHHVPGTFELTLGAHWLGQRNEIDAVICIGCVIQGDTRHFDFICDSVTQGLTGLNVSHNKPFIFGVLTTNTLEQAQDRAGGKHGNKGDEAAVTALKMLGLRETIKANSRAGKQLGYGM